MGHLVFALAARYKNTMTFNKSNLDELDHFKTLSSHWWDVQGPFRQLHVINPLRIAYLKEKAGIHYGRSENDLKPFQGLRILDVGCGGGILCEPLARLGAEVTGIDPVQENITTAKAHAEGMGLSITYLPCELETLPQDLPLFDIVVASEIIEHVADHESFLEACIAHLKPEGGLFITTFNKTLKSYLLGIVAAEYILRWAPPGTHSWDKFLSPQDLSHILSSFGWGNQDMTGLAFSPLRGGWNFSSSTDVNYFLWTTRPEPQRLIAASFRMREESMKVNREFAAIEKDPEI